MKQNVPSWAMRVAGPGDYDLAREAQGRRTMQVGWPDRRALREWARQTAWPAPWLGFEATFLGKMLEDEANFDLAAGSSGVEIRIPKQEHTIEAEELRQFDALYTERPTSAQPPGWGILVEELRQIRRAVEAGVVVRVEDTHTLRSWQEFYVWAHGRYYALEEGYDHWIGDDKS
jgi:hypothetical protein